MLTSFKSRITAIFVVVVFFVSLDRFLKILSLNEVNFPIIGKLFKFSFTANEYIAFSVPLSGWLLNIVISALVLAIIYFLLQAIKKQVWWETWGLSFVLAGASSNLFDRFKYGFVIDYFDLRYFTVFNLADVMIFCGVVSLLFLYSRKD
ncbi:MAG: Lipoprotein signal peptidase [Candidatus Falkowbacteria bacterium GW2011_GWF2_39_8]|uniref:Lipoprotein signal peptidase n=1 Tax=Candidatus Falkowbacteria bacterium GW2011_GWF2_39_8 TaxID=1618642 RepID=A0A0G0T7U8_9BACT|nr:MAG: Lipoprotein signal peptidase [Candidatus Falkowbacteria bacterium GW2011_GWF2_39_8]